MFYISLKLIVKICFISIDEMCEVRVKHYTNTVCQTSRNFHFKNKAYMEIARLSYK